MSKIQRALISVHNKTGIVDFAKSLSSLGVEILSSGGTFKVLRDAGIDAVEVSEYTTSPEVMNGRVKTLHPKIHGGILFRRDVESDFVDLNKIGGKPIDIVVVNLYPFAETIAKPDCTMDKAIENIDIGGPSMIRSAAKNFKHVLVIVDPDDYNEIIHAIKNNEVTENYRQKLSAKAFAKTCAYDSMIASYFGSEKDKLPEFHSSVWNKKYDLRYGENPHQRAALYERVVKVDGPDLANAKQLQGKELSYNNLLDANAAISLIREFNSTASVVLKHNNPCGVALGNNVAEAFVKARACDPTSAFGGIIAFNDKVDALVSEEISQAFYEVIIAPAFSDEAKEILSKKKNLRLLEMTDINKPLKSAFKTQRIFGGLLLQDDDLEVENEASWKVATEREPTPEERYMLSFAWKVSKHVKSNAIVFCNNNATVGIGAGQMSRVDSVKLAIMKSLSSLKGSVLASDAFFPFPDGLIEAANAGATAVIQPGGSIKDDDVIKAANDKNIAMIFTGRRHFRH